MNSKEHLKNICLECEKSMGKIKTACPFRSLSNEYCEEYETIKKDLDRLEELEEKETPKEPVSIKNFLNDLTLCCPRCKKSIIIYNYDYKPNYCQFCGQKLKWDK